MATNQGQKETKLCPVHIAQELHERVRTEAFTRRIRMRQVVEEALIAHYGWGGGGEGDRGEQKTRKGPRRH